MNLRICAAVAALLPLAACSDSPTSTTPPVDIVVTASAGTPSLVSVPGDSVPRVQCTVTLHATATGKKDAKAGWVGGRVRFFAGPNHDLPIDSVEISPVDLQRAMGAQLTAGQSADAGWTFSAVIPFTVGGELHYQSGTSAQRTATFSAGCGPQSASAPPPAVSNLAVSPSTGELLTGDSIVVTYDVAAPAGAWAEEVTVQSGFVTRRYTYHRQFETSGSRHVRLETPYHAALGSPAHVSVRVTDAWDRSASAGPVETAPVADHRPPFLQAYAGPDPNDPLSGRWLVGDTIRIHQSAGDENGLGWLVWELLGPVAIRDSLAFTGSGDRDVGQILLPPAAAGRSQLRVWATDMAGNRSPVLTSGPDSVEVLPSRPYPIRQKALSRWWRDAALDGRHGLLYLASPVDVSAYSLSTLELVKTYPAPGITTADVTPSGDTIVAAADTLVTVFDVARSTTSTVRLAAGAHVAALRVAADGRVLAALSRPNGTALAAIDPSTGAVQPLAEDTGAAQVTGLTRSADHRRVLYAGACNRVYVADTGTTGACANRGHAALFELDGRGTLFVDSGTLYGAGFTPLATISLGRVTAAAAAPDGSYAFVNVETLGLLKVSRGGTVVDGTHLPYLDGHLLFTDDGQTLVALNESGLGVGTVYVLDLR